MGRRHARPHLPQALQTPSLILNYSHHVPCLAIGRLSQLFEVNRRIRKIHLETNQPKDPKMPSTTTRIRVLSQPQSRHGCQTCKTRRVRCDQRHPTCVRCEKAKRVCEGYLDRSEDITQSNGPLSNAGLASRCLQALHNGTPSPGSHDLSALVLSLNDFPASAYCALQALELLHSTLTALDSSHDVGVFAHIDMLYGAAVEHLSGELTGATSDSSSLLLSIMLLTAVELLQRRRRNGLQHSMGALSLIIARGTLSSSCDIDHLVRNFDLQCPLYSEGTRPPINGSSTVGQFDGEISSLLEIERYCLKTLHGIHAFIAKAHHETVTDQAMSPLDGDVFGLLQASSNATHILQTCLDSNMKHPGRPIALILLNLFLMTSLQLKQLYTTNETSWDAYATDFTTILQNAAEIRRLNAAHSNGRSFTLQPGLIAPLQLVAFKCRIRVSRHRAIAMLQTASCEGPFIGPQIAAMATRCAQIEDEPISRDHSSFPSHRPERAASSNPPSDATLPPEERRIARCALVETHDEANSRPTHPFRGTLKMRIMRRKHPISGVYANIVSSSAWKSTASAQQLERHKLDPGLWEQWVEEDIQFGG